MVKRNYILLAVGISLLVLTLTAGAQDEQWLQYHSEREAQQIIGGMSSSRTVTSNKPQDVKLPEFKTKQQFFLEWATPMVKSGRLWIALDRTSEQGKWDRLFIDSNCNGHLDDEDAVTAYRTDTLKIRHSIMFHRLLSIFVLTSLTQSVVAEDIKSILRDYASARSTFDSVSATCSYSYEQVVYNGGDILFEGSANKSADFRRDNELFEFIIRDVTDRDLTEETFAITSRIWDGEKEYQVYRSPNIDVNNKDGYSVTVRKDNTIMKSLSLYLVYSNLTGIFYGDTKSFDEILSTSSAGTSSLRYETIESSKCIVLESDNSYGNFQVWIDPERGYNIVKAIITKGPEDIYLGRPLKSYEYATTQQDETSSNKSTKTRTMTEAIVKIDNVTLEKQGHLWVPVGSTHEKILKFSDGVINNVKINCKVEQLEVAPDFDKIDAFKIKVPNGTRVYIEGFPEIRYEWQDGKVVDGAGNLIDYKTIEPVSLIGKALPELTKFNLRIAPKWIENKMVLVCFFDMEQRPSRHCMIQLTKQAEQLRNKDVSVIAVQASKIDREVLNQWVKKYNIPFPVGMIQGDAEKACFAWGVQSLPWLILTLNDSRHIVSSEGFSLGELDDKINAAK